MPVAWDAPADAGSASGSRGVARLPDVPHLLLVGSHPGAVLACAQCLRTTLFLGLAGGGLHTVGGLADRAWLRRWRGIAAGFGTGMAAVLTVKIVCEVAGGGGPWSDLRLLIVPSIAIAALPYATLCIAAVGRRVLGLTG